MIFIFNVISWFTLIHCEFTWMKNIKKWLGHTYNGCVGRAEDWKSWRSMIADLLLVDGTWWWWWVWEPFKQHLSLYVTLFGGICCLPSNFAKTELICCSQKTLLFHLGVQISFYLKINILKVMVHLTQLHWIKTLLDRKIFCATLIPTLNFNYSFM